MKKKATQYFFVSLGTLFLLIGIIGIFLPLLPTTPFLLLTALCFNKGSDQFHSWLLNHRYLGPPIVDWQANGVIRTRYKALSTAMMIFSSYFVMPRPTIPMVVKIIYVIFTIGLLTFIWTRKGRRSETQEHPTRCPSL